MKLDRQWSLAIVLLLLSSHQSAAVSIAQKQRAFIVQQQQASASVDAESQSQVDAAATTDAVAASATASAAAAAAIAGVEYKSDALDELLGDSLFKKKKQCAPPATEETLVDQVLNAQVDLKELNLSDTSTTTTPAAPQQDQQPADESNLLVEQTQTQNQQSKDMQLIENHLQKFTGTKTPEVGSAILYSAINDLDLGEAKIPEYEPPGMPKKGQDNALYGTDYAPASAWTGADTTPKSVDLTELSSDDLNGQSPTRLSAEAYVRGGNKYMEQAEQLIDNQDKELKDNKVVQQLIQLQKNQKEQEEKETEEMISTAFNSMKTTSKKATNVASDIQLQNDLMYVAAFGT